MIGHRAVLSFLSSSFPLWPSNVSLTFLNVCGSNALTSAIQKWAASKHVKAQIVETRELKDPKFLLAQKFDYVVTDGGLHGKTDAELEAFLVTANRLAKRGLALTDYLRDPRGAIWMMAVALVTGRSIREAEAAVQGGFTIEEVRAATEKAGLAFATVRKTFGYRFVISGERGLVLSPELGPSPGLAGA